MKLEKFAELYNLEEYGITTEKQKELIAIALRAKWRDSKSSYQKVGRPRAVVRPDKPVALDAEMVKLYFELLVERCVIFARKELGGKLEDGTYTKNEILRDWRFCNVFRDYDKFSRALVAANLPPVVSFIMRWSCCQVALDKIVARKERDPLLADSIKAAAEGNAEPFVQWLLEEHKYGMPLTGISYLVLHSDDDEMILRNRAEWGYKLHELLDNAEPQSQSLEQLTLSMVAGMPQVGEFLAGCLLTDWCLPHPELFTDSYTWVAFGPGATRGAKTLAGEGKTVHPLAVSTKLLDLWKEHVPVILEELKTRLGVELAELDKAVEGLGLTAITKRLSNPTMLDVEHWMCEFDKYTRIMNGEKPNGRRAYDATKNV